jgi:ABC-2 type transport system permease protein
MIGLLRASWVIARRDYVATVWSRTFLIFLIAPLLPALLAITMTGLGDHGDHADNGGGGIALVADPVTAHALIAARARLAARLGDGFAPALMPVAANHGQEPRLTGDLDHPRLIGPQALLDDARGGIALIVDEARSARALGQHLPPPVALATIATEPLPASDANGENERADVARGGQLALFFLTILLAGMMVSNMVEEKSNKVIELLAAAVPIDAIFFGKLLAILAASLTGIAVWGAIGGGALMALMPGGSLPTPALGWPLFLLLALLYFVTIFLLWGALYLGLGAQAGSAREAQTLSMPLTLGEAFAYVIAAARVGHPDSVIGWIAALVPWSSPFAMIGRAATGTALWPHLAALAWQFLWIAISIRVGARLFRTNILKSGGKSWFARRRPK